MRQVEVLPEQMLDQVVGIDQERRLRGVAFRLVADLPVWAIITMSPTVTGWCGQSPSRISDPSRTTMKRTTMKRTQSYPMGATARREGRIRTSTG